MALLYAKASDGYLASIPVNVMGFTQSLASNGWQKLPSGLIIQWGCTTVHENHVCKGYWAVSFNSIYRSSCLFSDSYKENLLTVGERCDEDSVGNSMNWTTSFFFRRVYVNWNTNSLSERVDQYGTVNIISIGV